MNKHKHAERVILYIIFSFYILLLVKLLFLSRLSTFAPIGGEKTASRYVNFIPFYSIMDYLFSSAEVVRRFSFTNLVGNIAVFIPLGVYLPLFKKNKNVSANLIIVFAVSLFAETVQWLFGIGAADIDDIILNCLGGLLGILLYKLFMFLSSERRAHTTITGLSLSGLPIIFYLLFIAKMNL